MDGRARVRITREGPDPSVLEADGFCRKVSGRYHAVYEEQLGDSGEITVSHVVISDDRVEVRKKGEACAVLVFEKGKTHTFSYVTRFGSIPLELRTKDLSVSFAENAVTASIRYTMAQDGAAAEECGVVIEISEKAPDRF